MARWLIYALGGGWGHLTRAIALGRQAARQHQVTILTNSHYARYVGRYLAQATPHSDRADLCCIVAGNLTLACIPPKTAFAEVCQLVRDRVTLRDFDYLIVDTFPRGLGGELVDLLPTLAAQLPVVLVHRDLNPHYLASRHLKLFIANTFARIIIPGDLVESELTKLPQAVWTQPWLMRDRDELPTASDARSLLKLPHDERPSCVVLASGLPEEMEGFGLLATSLAQENPNIWVRCVAPWRPTSCRASLWVEHWPAIECLPAADLVVGAGGYNTVAECRYVGVPLVAWACERLYDRQHLRLHAMKDGCAIANHAKEAVELVTQGVGSSLTPHQGEFPNGVSQAIACIHST